MKKFPTKKQFKKWLKEQGDRRLDGDSCTQCFLANYLQEKVSDVNAATIGLKRFVIGEFISPYKLDADASKRVMPKWALEFNDKVRKPPSNRSCKEVLKMLE